MKTLGGYFELELPQRGEYHQDAIRLNTGRNAFEYILRAKGYRNVFLPYYICDAMLEPVHKLGLTCEFYNIDETFRPLFDYSCLGENDVFVYVNYFGICDTQVEEIGRKGKNIVIDNSQAFFSMPLKDTDTFYSPRKFFGVPDGAYLYTDKILSELEKDLSYMRFSHLLKNIDLGSENGYTEFRRNEDALANQPIKKMSKLTQRLLGAFDYSNVAQKRLQNFNFLHRNLEKYNCLDIKINDNSIPMVYPCLFLKRKGLKNKLISQKIFVATYWSNVLMSCEEGSFEYKLSEDVVFLPIDQRYGLSEMLYLCDTVRGFVL